MDGVTDIEENGLMLAAFDFASYSTAVHKLETDDRIVMYTDGVVEASNVAGDFFGHDALCDLLTRTRELSPRWRLTRSFLLSANGRRRQDDDLTVLIATTSLRDTSVVKSLIFVASWECWTLRWHGKEYSESETSRTARSVHKGSRCHKLKGL